MPLVTKKINQNNAAVVIARDINHQGAKEYVGLGSYDEIFPFIENQEEKCFHEVMIGLQNRKIYFDFDLKAGEGDFPEMCDFVQQMKEFIVLGIDALFGATADPNDIIFAESHRSDKFSVHIHVPTFNTTVENMKYLFKLVDAGMTKIGMKGLDNQIYKPNQTLRLLGCHKKDKPNHILKLFTTSCIIKDTLVGYLGNSTELFLRPEIQKAVDDRKAEEEERRVSRQLVAPKDPEFYRALCEGLAQKRANDYGYWNKVCMALGHENAGVEVAMEFSRRSAKFNEASVRKAYEKGREGFAGRPLTCGTLMAYLKEDNLQAFRKLIPEPEIDYSEMIKGMAGGLETESDDDEDADDLDDASDLGSSEPKKTQEEKLARWLSAPDYFLNKPVDDAVDELGDDDEVETYEERFMKPYPVAGVVTMIVKAQKGQGKTHQLVDYIKKNGPKRVVFLSFRRSFSKELLKRLKPLGFQDYRGITGGIKDDVERVIIQVESLNRLHWKEQADLVVFDEIESIRSQLFSPTVRFKTPVMEKYAMLMKTAKVVVAMDADVSGNTTLQIKQTRGGKIHYIENEHKEIQEKFNEFYTTRMSTMQIDLCKALDAREKLVIPMNRSVKFMEALRSEIVEKYPDVKIQVYNSKTIRKKEVADELDDVAVSWKKYDVVMYSPTISAGVSFDEEHFDKCFCYFVNNGKINSMRQMINRVRNFSTNEYYYCLQAFGGTGKPTTVSEYESHICSNRFLGDKPDCVVSEEDCDGTREYPYKNTGYWSWIYNEVEKNRDKNMFLYNFLREQYNAGVGSMQMMGDDVGDFDDDFDGDIPDGLEEESEVEEVEAGPPKITKEDLERAKAKLGVEELVAIANAELIDDTQKKEIETRFEKEIEVSEPEVLSFHRKNLLDCYELDDFTAITPEFVKTYAPGNVRQAYRNRKLLGQGLKKLMKEEGDYFNGVCEDTVSVQDDLAKKYKSAKMSVAIELVKIAGFKSLYDTEEIAKKKMLKRFKKNEDMLISKMPWICSILGRSKRRIPQIDEWGDAVYLQHMLKFINSILEDLFCLKIKQTGHRSGKYKIDGLEMFEFDEDDKTFFEN
jgi:hypothetical protein